jgi:hypothetical protein
MHSHVREQLMRLISTNGEDRANFFLLTPDSFLLTPDSFLLTPDSFLLTPDSRLLPSDS